MPPNVMKPHTTKTQYSSDISSQFPHLTDVVAAGGSDGLVDHLLTHDAAECLLDTTQQTSLREGTMQIIQCTSYCTLHYCNSIAYRQYTVSKAHHRMYSKPNDNKQSYFVFSQHTVSYKYTHNNTVIVYR